MRRDTSRATSRATSATRLRATLVSLASVLAVVVAALRAPPIALHDLRSARLVGTAGHEVDSQSRPVVGTAEIGRKPVIRPSRGEAARSVGADGATGTFATVGESAPAAFVMAGSNRSRAPCGTWSCAKKTQAELMVFLN